MAKHLTGTQVKALVELYGDGVGVAQIADAMGVTRTTVLNHVRAAGVARHRQDVSERMTEYHRLRRAAQEVKAALDAEDEARRVQQPPIRDDWREKITEDEEPVDLLGDLIEYGDDAEDLKSPVVEDDDWGREMLRTLKAIADALGVAV